MTDASGSLKNRLARLAPAPAPKVDEERLMENLKDFKTFDNRMHGKPAPETGKCTCPPNSLDVLCPLPIKDHGAPAPCEHSWVEEENEADQRQTACQKCGAVCSTGSKDPLHQSGWDPPAPPAA